MSLGLLVVRGCLRDYFHDTANAVADDPLGLPPRPVLSIVVGAAMMLIGGCMVVLALNSGSTLFISSEFPFVSVERRTVGPPNE